MLKIKIIKKYIIIAIILTLTMFFGGLLALRYGDETILQFGSRNTKKTSSSISVSLSISSAPRVGEVATLTLSVTPFRDGPWMKVSFKVPDGIEVVSVTGTRSMIEEIRQPPSLQIDQEISMKARETRSFEIVVRVLREGRFEISGGASILDIASGGRYRDHNGSAIVLDVGGNRTRINPPPPALIPDARGGVGERISIDREITPHQSNLLQQNADENTAETTTKTPDLSPSDKGSKKKE